MSWKTDARRQAGVPQHPVCFGYEQIRRLTIAYVALPLAVFLFTWVKPAIGAPLGALLVLAAVLCAKPDAIRAMRREEGRNGSRASFDRPADLAIGCGSRMSDEPFPVTVGAGPLVALAMIAVAWCVLGGQGGFWYQSNDWAMRNALFRDLVTHSWPVYYNGGEAAMSYYMAYWLPAASVGRILVKAGVALEVAWPIANWLLLAWTAAGVYLLMLLAIVTLRARSARAVFGCVALLVFFSTPDTIGLLFTQRLDAVAESIHLEWWACGWDAVGQYSSITTCLFWVFNQSVVPWLCTVLFLNERRFCNYFLIWVCCLNCGPFPSVGLAFLMVGHGVGVVVKSMRDGLGRELRSMLAGILSPQNAVGALCIVPVALFFLANAATAHTGEAAAVSNLLAYPLWLPEGRRMLATLFCFIAVEGLLVPLLVLKDNKRKPLYWCIIATLACCPFIRFGQAADFCMRASIPALLSLYVLCADYLVARFQSRADSGEGPRRTWATWVLVAVLALGAVTPCVEFYRGFYHVATEGLGTVFNDAGTLEGRDFSMSNFGLQDPQGAVFFKYLAP